MDKKELEKLGARREVPAWMAYTAACVMIIYIGLLLAIAITQVN